MFCFCRESMETLGNQTLFCWRRFYSKTTKIRTIHSSNGKNGTFFSKTILIIYFIVGTSIYQSTRDTSRIKSHFSIANHRREEKSKFTIVHLVGCYHQRNSTRGNTFKRHPFSLYIDLCRWMLVNLVWWHKVVKSFGESMRKWRIIRKMMDVSTLYF